MCDLSMIWLHCQDGATPVYIAAQENNVDALEALHRMGADVKKAKEVGKQRIE